MTVKIAQYKGKSLTSRLIKFITRGQYSHTSIILGSGRIVEAWQGSNSVRVIRTLSDGHKPGTPVDIYSVRMSSEQERLFTEYVEAQIGKKYDYWGIVGFLLRRDLQRSENSFCSEIFAAGCEFAKVGLLNNLLPSQTSPSMITRSPITKLIERRIV
ncbi:MAG: hypothetical protein JKX92_05995 [Porticoccaceae bacterium]|nr:hypothetical protein [Porticoccaceae bacterium]